MTALAVVGTAGGVGATTLAALTFLQLRDTSRGAPLLYGAPRSPVLTRVGSDTVPTLDEHSAVWDAGFQTPDQALGLRDRGFAVVVATSATALGIADASRYVQVFGNAGAEALSQFAIVVNRVNGRAVLPGSLRSAQRVLAPATVHRVPYDARLARAGAITGTSVLTRRAVTQWQERAESLMARS